MSIRYVVEVCYCYKNNRYYKKSDRPLVGEFSMSHYISEELWKKYNNALKQVELLSLKISQETIASDSNENPYR